MEKKTNISKNLVKILWIFSQILVGCNRSIPIANEDDNPHSKMAEIILEETSKHRGNNFEYHALVGISSTLDGYINYSIVPPDTSGFHSWGSNFYKYLYIEMLSFTKNDTLVEAYYFIKEKSLMYKCKNQIIKGTGNQIDVKKLPYDSSHFGLKFIQTQDTNLLEPNTKYLITQVKRIGKLKWKVKAQTLWKKD